MTSVEETEAFLAHAGVKGMKWGKRKAGAGEFKSEKVKKPKVTNDDIKAARARQTDREIRLQEKAFGTYTAKTQKGRAAAQEAYNRAEKKVFSHPDAATANKMTTGEKVSTGLLVGVYGSILLGSIALSASSGKNVSYPSSGPKLDFGSLI